MRQAHLAIVALFVGFCGGYSAAHQAPINVFVDAATNRLYTLPNFAAGRLELVEPMPGMQKISTTTPGIGISFPSNGVTVGTELMIDALPGLYYWNGGSSLSPTPETLTWDPPVEDVLGNPTYATGHYDFFEGSGQQLGMTWGTYVDTFFWEADGTHELPSLAAAPGVYGTVIRLRSDRNLASFPFVVPFVYDPFDQWDRTEEDAGVAVMRALASTSMPGDFNSDDNFDCRDVDALVAQIAGGVYDARYDRTDDGRLDGADLSQWLTDAAAFNLLPSQSYHVGDANLDGVVDGSDFNIWNANKFLSTAAWCRGDFNADGSTDGSDFNLWNSQKFSGLAAAVPEPGWAWCLWLGVLAGVRFLAGRRGRHAPTHARKGWLPSRIRNLHGRHDQQPRGVAELAVWRAPRQPATRSRPSLAGTTSRLAQSRACHPASLNSHPNA